MDIQIARWKHLADGVGDDLFLPRGELLQHRALKDRLFVVVELIKHTYQLVLDERPDRSAHRDAG